jgi:hypothetical protein
MAAVYQAVGTIGGIYLSYNYGQTWNYVQVCNYYVGLFAMSASGQYMLATPGYTGSTTSGYIFISSNYGQTWTQTMQYFSGNGAGGVAVSGNGQYMAYVYSGVTYLSSTYGQTWSTLSLANTGVIAMSYTGQYIAISFPNNGVYISSNYGVSFSTNTTPSAPFGISMSSSGQYILVNSYGNGTIYTSINYGSTFSIATTTGFANMYGSAISGSGQYQLAVCNASGFVYTSVTPMIIPSFITTTGNVGIGTTTTTYPLNVVGNINLTGSILYNGTAITTGTGSIWTAGGGGVAYYNGGNVGIGMASPGYKLSVYGTTNATFAGPHIAYYTNANSYPMFHQLNYSNDNISFNFDMFYNDAWTASSSSVSWQLYKSSGSIRFIYAPATTAGTIINNTLTTAMSINPGANVTINGINNLFSLVNTSGVGPTYMSFTANGTNYGFIGLDNSSGVGLFGSNVAYGFDIGTPSATPFSFFTSNLERMRIAPNGNVGIGSSGPQTNLDMGTGKILANSFMTGTAPITASTGTASLNTNRIQYSDNTSFYIVSFSANAGAYLNGANANSWSFQSDSRLKNTITTISSALSLVNKLRPVTYIYNKDVHNHVRSGFIAQEVQSIFSNQNDTIVNMNQNDTLIDKDGLSYNPLSLCITDLIPYLTKAIQEHNGLIQQQQAQLTSLQTLVESQSELIASLQTQLTQILNK